MPQNKRESIIFTVMMCFVMVFWMSMYNVALNMGGLSIESIQAGWLGFPIAYIYAMCFDWFLVSKIAKWFSFRFIVKPTSKPLHIILSISSCMVVQMVIVMSFYGALELCFEGHIGWDALVLTWLTNIPKNFIMALPFQLLVAGPLVRKLFRKAFPEGKVLA